MDLQNPPFEPCLNSDNTAIAIKFKAQELNLSAPDLDELIAWLGHYRSQLRPAVPVSSQGVERFYFADHCLVNRIVKDGKSLPTETGANFLFQSPLFGWFQHPATPAFCRGLISWLEGKANEELQAPSGVPLQ